MPVVILPGNTGRFTLTYVNQSLEKETRLTRSGLAWTGKTIGAGYNQFVKNAPELTQRVLAGIGHGASTLTSTIASEGKYAVDTTMRISQDTVEFTSEVVANATNSVVAGTMALTKGVSFAIVSTAQNGVEKLNDISHEVGTAIIKIGYLFLPEPTRISEVRAVVLSPTSVKISWKTNHHANGKVNWGYDDGVYEFEQQADDMTDQHEFILSNLKPDTEYHYEVMSQSKNYVYDANRQFKTLPITGYSQ